MITVIKILWCRAGNEMNEVPPFRCIKSSIHRTVRQIRMLSHSIFFQTCAALSSYVQLRRPCGIDQKEDSANNGQKVHINDVVNTALGNLDPLPLNSDSLSNWKSLDCWSKKNRQPEDVSPWAVRNSLRHFSQLSIISQTRRLIDWSGGKK